MHIWGAKETYSIGDMFGQEQARLVEESLQRLPGMVRVQADPAQRTVSVIYQVGRLAPGSIETAIRRMGFAGVRRA